MSVRSPLAAARRIVVDALRAIRRLIRQAERRQRYRRLHWV